MPHDALGFEENSRSAVSPVWYVGVMPCTSIVIHERTREDGTLHVMRLVRDAHSLVLDDGDQALPLPDGAIDAVMRRYGKPLEGSLPHAEEVLDLGSGKQLVRFRFLSRFDVIARDYLALVTPNAEPVCELAVSVTGALEHLARAHASAHCATPKAGT